MDKRILNSGVLLLVLGGAALAGGNNPQITRSSSDEYLVTISAGKYSLQEKTDQFGTYTEIITEESFNISSGVGKPQLPNKPFTLNGEYEYELVSVEYDTLYNITIRPENRPLMIGPDFYDTVKTLEYNPLYNRNRFWPEEGIVSQKFGIFKGVPVTSFKATPFSYNPVSKTLLSAKELSVRCKKVDRALQTRAAQAINPVVNNILPVERTLRAGSDENSFIESNGRAGKIVVFTIDSLLPAVEKLVRWQKLKGYDVVLESRAERYPKGDVISAIERELTQSDAVSKYMLIIGNTQMVQEYEVSWKYFNSIGNLQGVSCSRYGDTEGDDHLPEIARGVVPANNLNEAMIAVDKFIKYETDPVREPSFYNNILAAAQQGFSHKGVNYIMDYMDNKGYTTAPRLYENEDSPAVVDRMNDGVIIAAQYDHGYRGGWATPEFTGNQINVMENGDKLPYMFSINCLSGSWDYANGMDKWNPKPTYEPDFKGLTERFLFKENGGGIGALGATNITYTGFNDYLLFGLFKAIWPEDETRVPIYRTGDILDYGLFHMHESKGVTDVEYGDKYADEEMCDYHFQLYHNMCDPTLQIRTEVPTEVTASFTPSLNGDRFSINGVNLPEATAVLYNEVTGDVIGRTRINSGSGDIAIASGSYSVGDSITLAINGDNCVPLISTFASDQATDLKGKSFVSSTVVTLNSNSIAIDNTNQKEVSYRIYTLQGKIVFQGVVPAGNKIQLLKKRLNLATGTYLLNISVDNNVQNYKLHL